MPELNFKFLKSIGATLISYILLGCTPNEEAVNQCIHEKAELIIKQAAINASPYNYGGQYNIRIIKKSVEKSNVDYQRSASYTAEVQSKEYNELKGVVSLNWKVIVKHGLKFGCYDDIVFVMANESASPLSSLINKLEEMAKMREIKESEEIKKALERATKQIDALEKSAGDSIEKLEKQLKILDQL